MRFTRIFYELQSFHVTAPLQVMPEPLRHLRRLSPRVQSSHHVQDRFACLQAALTDNRLQICFEFFYFYSFHCYRPTLIPAPKIARLNFAPYRGRPRKSRMRSASQGID